MSRFMDRLFSDRSPRKIIGWILWGIFGAMLGFNLSPGPDLSWSIVFAPIVIDLCISIIHNHMNQLNKPNGKM